MLTETRCLFCNDGEDVLLYPPRLRETSFTPHTFSARRERGREHYRIVACKRCGLVRSNPILNENKINSLYAESCFIFADEAPHAARTYATLLSGLMKRHSDGRVSSVLEVGSSTGFFLEQMRAMGIESVCGFEPSKDCRMHARETIRDRIINDVYRPDALDGKRFDLACGFHVFDHLTHPLETLFSLKESLNPGGYVLLVCHDVESWSAKLLGEHSPIFDVEHIYLFSQQTIRRLFRSAEIRPLEVGSVANRYPLGYWMRMLPVTNQVAHAMPAALRNVPITLKGGNLYAFGQIN